MAKVSTPDGSKRRGKMNRKSDEVHRVREDGHEQSYIFHPSDKPASKKQKSTRSFFGKVTSAVNAIVNDPVRYAEWQKKMEEYNSSLNMAQKPQPRRFLTVRSFAHHIIKQQLLSMPSTKRRLSRLPLTLPRGVKMNTKVFAELTNKELYEILKARFAVFVAEQHIEYVDEDDIDYLATHFFLSRQGRVIAYARLFEDAQSGVWRIGRMLTVERGRGYGRYLMQQIIDTARSLGASTLCLHAQLDAVPFYRRFAFQPVGDIFQEANLPHLRMSLTL